MRPGEAPTLLGQQLHLVTAKLPGARLCPHSLAPAPARPLDHLPGEDRAAAPRERVGVLLPEHVSHAAAGDDLQAAAALPHAERDLCGDEQTA